MKSNFLPLAVIIRFLPHRSRDRRFQARPAGSRAPQQHRRRLHEPAAFRESLEVVRSGRDCRPGARGGGGQSRSGAAQPAARRRSEGAAGERPSKAIRKDAHAWYSLGLYYKNSSSAGLAVDAFRRVTEIDPNDADTWYFLGSTYAQLKQFPEAIAAFEHALKLDPHHASAEFGLARAYQQSGQADPAHEAMKKFQYITQNKLGAPISLAYGEQGKYSRAEDSPVAVQKVPPQIAVRFVDVTRRDGTRCASWTSGIRRSGDSLSRARCVLSRL